MKSLSSATLIYIVVASKRPISLLEKSSSRFSSSDFKIVPTKKGGLFSGFGSFASLSPFHRHKDLAERDYVTEEMSSCTETNGSRLKKVKMNCNSPRDRTRGKHAGKQLLSLVVLLGVLWHLPSVQAGCTWNGISPDANGLVTIPASVTSIDGDVSSRLLGSVPPLPRL